jgi:hypothetical protein
LHSIKAIRALQPRKEILEFAEFIYASAGNRPFPDMADIDLMQIPRLVPHIYIMDFRNGIEDGLLIKFAGTRVEANFKQQI